MTPVGAQMEAAAPPLLKRRLLLTPRLLLKQTLVLQLAAIKTMARFQEMYAALNAPGVVTAIPLSFNQLKIEIANRLHIEADDAAFIENKQALCDAYIALFYNVCRRGTDVSASHWINRRHTLADQIYEKLHLKKDAGEVPMPRWTASVRRGSSRLCWHCDERIRGSEKHTCSVCK